MHFYKPVTYTVKSFSILEQVVFLWAQLCAADLQSLIVNPTDLLTTATLINTTLRPRVQYHKLEENKTSE